jgi:hypothetical protein
MKDIACGTINQIKNPMKDIACGTIILLVICYIKVEQIAKLWV